ncbi:MAG TPA: AMP-binding protein [Vicinamibacterales bacterium]|nr:AMP-binding protein [Vicinamibacterales bacterium]
MIDRGTAHIDTFVRDHLPPRELWPETDWTGVPELSYRPHLNAAALLLDEWIARGHGGRPALHHASGTWSYQRLFTAANRIAHVLVEDCGLVPGNRVLLRATNQPMLIASWFAVLKAGGVAVTTMSLHRTRELSDIIQKADVTLALCDAAVASDLEAVLLGRERGRVLCFNSQEPDALDALMSGKPPAFKTIQTRADDPAIIAFTSGTTGRSKGTVHTHRDLMAVTDTYGRHVLRPDPGDVFIGSPPVAFTYALGGLVLFPMRCGASTALLEQASPPLLLEGIEKFRATVLFTSPTAYRAMLGHIGEADLSSLRLCVSAGETLPAATFLAWEAATRLRLMDGIGSTEMLHMFIGSQAGDARPGSTGRVVPGYKARVVDDEGREVPRGTIGRLAVMGPTGCRYLDDLANQRKYVQDGWNFTGDAYRQDEDGYFWYVSRTDDMIVTSGYNVSGVEVENVLLMHPAVAECAVVGVADDARGQVVKAFVVTAPGGGGSDALARELQEFVKSQLAPYKYPRAVEFVADLPRTLTGKLQRFRLRAGAAVESHEPPGWPRPKGYANAVSATGRLVFVSGQIGWDPVTCRLSAADFAAEVRQALTNVVSALAAAGARPDQITRLTWYVTDRGEYARHQREIGLAYREVIGRHFPAMSVVVVHGLVEERARVEIEATAVIGS